MIVLAKLIIVSYLMVKLAVFLAEREGK